jgi:hypothetical protein
MSKSEAGILGSKKSKITQRRKHDEFVAEYLKKPKLCVYCQKEMEFDKRRNDFCSRTCSAIQNNLERGFNSKNIRKCLLCGNTTKNSKFCSIPCRVEYDQNYFIEEWLNGRIDGVISNGMGVSSYIRKWIMEQNGNCCSICGWCEVNPVTNRVPIQLDHIDGNSENNDPSNLRLLCPNCHSLTPNFGSLNIGNGRKYRYRS